MRTTRPGRSLWAASAANVAVVGVRTVITAALLAALTAVTAATLRVGGDLGAPGHLLIWYGVGWALFAAAAWTVRKVPPRAAAALVLIGGVALSAAALSAPPRTSDDMYRYAWDGRVQAAGISPYAYPPAAPQLARLRDPWLFPSGTGCQGWDLHQAPTGVCTHINRPTVHTIYPPVAEGWYLGVHAVSPAGSRHKPFQIAGAVLAVATTGALLLVLRRRGDPWQAALWAWCPAVPIGAVNDAHVDTLGVLFTVLAFGVGPGVRRGALVGAGIAVKLLPGLVLPGALSGLLAPGRRLRDRLAEAARVLVPAVLVVALAYLPYVLVSGTGVIGYLPGYLHEEGYDAGSVGRFAVLRLVLPDAWAGPVAIAAIALAALYVLRRGDPQRPWRGALLVTGTALLVTSPGYYWYALLVVALVALDGRWEWLAVPAAGMVLYIETAQGLRGIPVQAWPFGLAAVIVATGAAVRLRAGRRGDA
ncbi:glycosyltransferase 87 family protein [Streptomyces ferralitis]|uniref:Glycosyltransferase 87 family protein n=1 Tax=Streptantibioticus ferralitis TaxID=236510 RepID=A0ABT5Z2Z3_9ACTN|nr:glycosyltransferase 87 family protein [Streptantibioticus ferralitis]MDF2258191.1 glycosyltransferase 87 family protein [Streptantibioticus ferralitis]